MSAEQFLKTIFKTQEGKLFRGIDLGEPIEEVLKKEGETYKYNGQVVPFYTYVFPISKDRKFKFELIYYAEDGETLDQITMDAAHNSDADNDLTLEEFRALFDAMHQFLLQQHGKPSKKTVSHGEDKEVYYQWVIDTEEGDQVDVTLVRYRDSRSDVEDALKLEYMYYYE